VRCWNMTRRDFASAVALSAGVASSPPAPSLSLIKPPALREGDTVALITPATGVTDPGELSAAADAVRSFGLRPRLGANVSRQIGYLGGTIDQRLDDLHSAFRDPDVRGIFCIRGGYGSAQLLDRIDYGLIRSHPKIFVGYSDITALHLAIHKKAGLVTFHGPVIIFKGSTAHFNEYTVRWYRKALFAREPLGRLENPVSHGLSSLHPGAAHGRLTGGNLTLIGSLMGTPYEIDARGAILFTEEIGEQPYRIDRILTQLRLAGKLSDAAGVLFGECIACDAGGCTPEFTPSLSVREVLDEIVGKLNAPSMAGLAIGHSEDQLTLPLGVQATLDASRCQLTIDESAVS